MNEQQYKDLVAQIGREAADKIKAEVKAAEDRINQAAEDRVRGRMTKAEVDQLISDVLAPINQQLATVDNATKEIGKKVDAQLEKAAPNSKTFEQWLIEQKDKIIDLRDKGGFFTVTGAELKAAGISSIGNTIGTTVTGASGNPYAPGPSGTPLTIFDLRNNPNFITSRVDLGRTDSSKLLWANEATEEGSPAFVAEGAAKPLISSTYTMEMSQAKKIAAYEVITEEFEQDLPGFATAVRRKIQERVIRFWDDQIQIGVYSAARPYEITQLHGQIYDANLYDGLRAMMAQIGYYNYNVNGIAVNAIEEGMIEMGKGTDGHYLNPPFAARINALMVNANKMAPGFALVGDFSQYKVDIYKDFVLKIGWINDDFIKNQFCVLGEMRYHDYISSARKKALVYHNIQYVAGIINGTPHS
jgi:hypothetical protein